MTPEPPPRVRPGSGSVDFSVWVPFPNFAENAGDPYADKITGYIDPGSTAAWDVTRLEARRPIVALNVQNASFNRRRGKYVGELWAAPLWFCGNPDELVYTWRKSAPTKPQFDEQGRVVNQPAASEVVAQTGRGPVNISLSDDEMQVVEVTAQDRYGVEMAYDVRVFSTPSLRVIADWSCDRADTETVEFAVPAGQTKRGKKKPRNPTVTVCKKLTLQAEAIEVGDQKSVFNPTTPTGLTYSWGAVEIAPFDGSGNWRALPPEWEVTRDGTRMTVTKRPPAAGGAEKPRGGGSESATNVTAGTAAYFRFRTSVSATDDRGRRAESWIEDTNSVAPVSELVALVLKFFEVLRPDETPPESNSCAGACREEHATKDAFWKATAVILARLQALKNVDNRKARNARESVELFVDYGLQMATKGSAKPYRRTPRSVSLKRKPTPSNLIRAVQKLARKNITGRLRDDAALSRFVK